MDLKSKGEQLEMADKLVIVMGNTDPRNALQLAPPLSQAIVAATMEFEVEMIFTGYAGEILQRGKSEQICVSPNSARTVYDMIQEAHEAGVKIKVCTSALQAWGDDLIPEVSETVGDVYLISEAMDNNTVVFTY